jgi:hypothetical protein
VAASTVGVRVTVVIRCRRSISRSGAPGIISSNGANHRQAPEPKASSISKMDASKLGDANWSTRSSAVSGWTSRVAAAVLARPRWVMRVPFGRPVEPDVYIT